MKIEDRNLRDILEGDKVRDVLLRKKKRRRPKSLYSIGWSIENNRPLPFKMIRSTGTRADDEDELNMVGGDIGISNTGVGR